MKVILRKNKENKKKEEAKQYQESLNFTKHQKEIYSTSRKVTKRLRRNPNATTEITGSPSFNSLREKEKDLVIQLNLDPKDYLKMKKLMIVENEKNKIVKESFIPEACKQVDNSIKPQQVIGKFLINKIINSIHMLLISTHSMR